jgi:hypothetical protein
VSESVFCVVRPVRKERSKGGWHGMKASLPPGQMCFVCACVCVCVFSPECEQEAMLASQSHRFSFMLVNRACLNVSGEAPCVVASLAVLCCLFPVYS